jgi:D-glycero-D-manno-heptose 1,7-bisphosphate phosphatase
MIEFHGKPFVEYIIEMLRDQGFTKVLLLLGYLPEVFTDHFGDGVRLGTQITYSVTKPDDLTVHRMRVARPLLDDCFLLLYCDNYWPMQFDDMWDSFVKSGAPAQSTIYRNRDGYSRDGVIVDDHGMVTVFDRTRTTPNLSGVEISYAIITREVLDLMPDGDELFEQAVYPPLASQGLLAAYLTDHRYYSVGSFQRLSLTETFLARHPTVLLDRDGVLNERQLKARYVRSSDEFVWLPGAKEALRLFARSGYRIIVLTNQAGIGRGQMTVADLAAIHERMSAEAEDAGGRVDAIYYCPHAWDDGCDCRKPRPGMFFAAQRDFQLDLTRTIYIGDDSRDRDAAAAAGCPFYMVTPTCSLHDLALTLTRKETCHV